MNPPSIALLRAPWLADKQRMVEQDLSVGELLAGYSRILAELRRRGVVRSNNAPAGDYAEWLCAKALRATLVKNFSVKSYDLLLEDGGRVQVKARLVSDPLKRGQLQTSPFRSWEFELAAFVLLRHTDYEVRRAVLVPQAVVQSVATYRPHVNGAIALMGPSLLDHEHALDITDRLRKASSQT